MRSGENTDAGRAAPSRLRILGARDRENALRARVGLLPLGATIAGRARLLAWLGPLVMTIIGGVLRFIGLEHPARLTFDETYYVKDAYTLDRFGFSTHWEPSVKGSENTDRFFEKGDYREMTDKAKYVVHGDVGKWLISFGMRLFGADNGLGWRFSAAVAGTLCILLLGRIAFRLFGSWQLATLSSGLLAIESVSIVLSRTALLDVFLTLFLLLAFWAVLRDKEDARAALCSRYSRPGWETASAGPALFVRPWLIVAGAFLGLGAGTKWSAFYVAVVLGLAAWWWDLEARRLVGAQRPVLGSITHGGIGAFMSLVPATIVVYVASWFSWFTHPDAFYRQWAAGLRRAGQAVPRGWLPDSLNSFLHYHLEMLSFHAGLENPHPYQSGPAMWLLQLRPTSIYWETVAENHEGLQRCGSLKCVEAITALGSPSIWWPGAIALLFIIYLAIRKDGRAFAILVGYTGTYFLWFLFANRTMYNFYTVAIAPFVVLAVVLSIGIITQHLTLATHADRTGRYSAAHFRFFRQAPPAHRRQQPRPDSGTLPGRWARFSRSISKIASVSAAQIHPADARTQRIGIVLAGTIVALTVALTAFWWPLLTGRTIPLWFWQLHIWMPSWI